jgi:hypothetical protein
MAACIAVAGIASNDTFTYVGCLAACLLLWGAWWTRLGVTENGLTVVNLRQMSIPWAAVRHLSLDPRRFPEWWPGTGPVLTITTQDGRIVRAWAVSVTRATSEQWCRDTLRAVQTAKRQHPSS